MTTPQLHPWQRTLRTVFQALIGLAVMLPLLVTEAGLDANRWPWLAGVLAIAAVIARIMATPALETFLARFLPWLSATASPAAVKRRQGGYARADYLLGLALALACGAFAALCVVALFT